MIFFEIQGALLKPYWSKPYWFGPYFKFRDMCVIIYLSFFFAAQNAKAFALSNQRPHHSTRRQIPASRKSILACRVRLTGLVCLSSRLRGKHFWVLNMQTNIFKKLPKCWYQFSLQFLWFLQYVFPSLSNMGFHGISMDFLKKNQQKKLLQDGSKNIESRDMSAWQFGHLLWLAT